MCRYLVCSHDNRGYDSPWAQLVSPEARKIVISLFPDDVLRKRLSNVYWIGGGSGAGKSTAAKWLARQRGLHLYDTDVAMGRHVQQSNSEDCPLLHRFLKMSMDERWIHRGPEEMFNSFHWYQGEGFQFIIDDLLALPAEQAVVAEGFRLLPSLVLPYLHSHSQAVWLLPTAEFREFAFGERGSMWEIPNKTSDPQRAPENLLKRAVLFTEKLGREMASNHLTALELNECVSKWAVRGKLLNLFGM